MKIVISGDSFTFGQGCKDKITVYDPRHKAWIADHDIITTSEYCWASLLQQHYPDCEVVNLAQPGRDNVYIATSIMDNLKDADLVIFAATGFNRMQVYNPVNDRTDSWVIGIPPMGQSPEYINATKEYIKYLYSEEYMAEVSCMSILAVAAQCQIRNIPFLWSASLFGMGYIDEDTTIAKNFNVRMCSVDNFRVPALFDYWISTYYGIKDVPKVEDNPWIHNDGHANELGHRYYFETEILPAVQKYLG